MTKREPKRTSARRARRTRGPYTLAIDIGGTHIKASILDASGRQIAKRLEVSTPVPAPPKLVLRLLKALAQQLPAYDRISVGFPGVVDHGRIRTAPNLSTSAWRNFPLAAELRAQLGKPARVLNDADVQGLGVIRGKGLECVVTLGTGFGSALYRDGELMPHLELGQHPFAKGKTYDQYLGSAALRRKGAVKWNRRVAAMIRTVRTLLNFDRLYIGGGDARLVTIPLPPDVIIVSNEAGITGGARLWEPALDRFF
jgi:polyphosphate glucokinase